MYFPIRPAAGEVMRIVSRCWRPTAELVTKAIIDLAYQRIGPQSIGVPKVSLHAKTVVWFGRHLETHCIAKAQRYATIGIRVGFEQILRQHLLDQKGAALVIYHLKVKIDIGAAKGNVAGDVDAELLQRHFKMGRRDGGSSWCMGWRGRECR